MPTQQRTFGLGSPTPSAEALAAVCILLDRDEAIGYYKVLSHPYYAWCGEYQGHRIDMVPVLERYSGCLSDTEIIWICVDNIIAGRWGVDGDAASLADFLRGGRWAAPVGVDLADTMSIPITGPIVAQTPWLPSVVKCRIDAMLARMVDLENKI